MQTDSTQWVRTSPATGTASGGGDGGWLRGPAIEVGGGGQLRPRAGSGGAGGGGGAAWRPPLVPDLRSESSAARRPSSSFDEGFLGDPSRVAQGRRGPGPALRCGSQNCPMGGL